MLIISGLRKLAVGEGFEPPVRLLAQRFSRAPRSTTPAPNLRADILVNSRSGSSQLVKSDGVVVK
jgi:hypothetical protein